MFGHCVYGIKCGSEGELEDNKKKVWKHEKSDMENFNVTTTRIAATRERERQRERKERGRKKESSNG